MVASGMRGEEEGESEDGMCRIFHLKILSEIY